VRITQALPQGSNLRPWPQRDLQSLASLKPTKTRSKPARQSADPATCGMRQECAGLVAAASVAARHGQSCGWHLKNAQSENGDALTKQQDWSNEHHKFQNNVCLECKRNIIATQHFWRFSSWC
jgi:hypothetical protein